MDQPDPHKRNTTCKSGAGGRPKGADQDATEPRRSWPDIDKANKNTLDRALPRRDEVDSQMCGQAVECAANLNSPSIKIKPPQIIAPIAVQTGEKVQTVFNINVDNSPDTLWMPIITEKPNSTHPWKIVPMLDKNGAVFGYRNPYEEEIRNFKLQPQWFELNSRIKLKSLEDTPYTYVETEEELHKLSTHLTTVDEIAIDVEHHNLRTYQGLTCLIQVSTEEGGDFIVDALKLRGKLECLNLAFTNGKIKKILHGAQSDIIWLQRDCGIYIVGLFDTHTAATVLKYKAQKLKDLVHKFCGVELDKKFQTADWSGRPLSEEQIIYARLDTHYLIYIAQCITAELISCTLLNRQKNLIKMVYDISRKTCSQAYIKPTVNDRSYLRLATYRRSLSKNQLMALKRLYEWRDRCARVEDESVSYILPDCDMLKLSEELPRNAEGIARACGTTMSETVKREIHVINQIMLESQLDSCKKMEEEKKTGAPEPISNQLGTNPTGKLRAEAPAFQPASQKHQNAE